MEVQFLRQDALDKLTKDIYQNIGLYANSKEPWLEEYFQSNEVKVPLFRTEINILDIDLILGDDATNDVENAIRIYEAFRGRLNPVQATDRRLWVALTHTVFYEYMCSRWAVENKLNDKGKNGTVTDRYFMSRGLFRNGVSRLYWIPELTYDEKLEDPYEYTRFLIGNQDLVNQVDGHSLCRNRATLKACLKILKGTGTLTESQKRLYFENLCKRGGVTVLDALPIDSIEALCQKALNDVLYVKQVSNGSKVYLQAINSNKRLKIIVKDGKVYIGKTSFRSKPENLYRLTVGKEVEIGKEQYRILNIG